MPDLFIPKTEKKPASLSSEQGGSAPGETQLIDMSKARVHALTSFCINPEGTTFETQEDGEQILLFLRSHFITNVPWIAIAIFFLIFPFIVQAIFTANPFLVSGFTFLTPSLLFVLLAIYYVLIFTFVFISFITWFYNIGLVTNIRVVDIDFADLIYHDVAVTKLNLIENVRYVQTGFIRSLFNYGDVFLETAGNTKDFDFLAVPRPAKIVEIIQNLIGGAR